jgi:hypothetical protein
LRDSKNKLLNKWPPWIPRHGREIKERRSTDRKEWIKIQDKRLQEVRKQWGRPVTPRNWSQSNGHVKMMTHPGGNIN